MLDTVEHDDRALLGHRVNAFGQHGIVSNEVRIFARHKPHRRDPIVEVDVVGFREVSGRFGIFVMLAELARGFDGESPDA